MDWDDPVARAGLLIAVGPDEYSRRFGEHRQKSVVTTVNGHAIRPSGSRFGRLFMVGDTGTAFLTLAEAEKFAGDQPAGKEVD